MTRLKFGSRFVVLMTAVGSTALIASAEGCSSKKSDDNPGPGVEGGTSGSSGTSGTSGSSGTSGTSGTSGSSGTSGTSGTSGGTDAGKDAAKDAADAADGAPACLNDTLVGAPPACPGAGACTAQCTTITANFKNGVAADAIKALTAGICQADTANDTTSASVAKACTDPTSKAFCDGLVAGGCTAALFPTFAADCLALTHGLAGTGVGAAATLGRKAFFDCLANDPVRDCATCQPFLKGKVN